MSRILAVIALILAINFIYEISLVTEKDAVTVAELISDRTQKL